MLAVAGLLGVACSAARAGDLTPQTLNAQIDRDLPELRGKIHVLDPTMSHRAAAAETAAALGLAASDPALQATLDQIRADGGPFAYLLDGVLDPARPDYRCIVVPPLPSETPRRLFDSLAGDRGDASALPLGELDPRFLRTITTLQQLARCLNGLPDVSGADRLTPLLSEAYELQAYNRLADAFAAAWWVASGGPPEALQTLMSARRIARTDGAEYDTLGSIEATIADAARIRAAVGALGGSALRALLDYARANLSATLPDPDWFARCPGVTAPAVSATDCKLPPNAPPTTIGLVAN